MTELKKVFKKKRKHYRKSTQRPWQTIGLWGRRGKGRQNRSNHAKADHSYENSKTGTAEGFAKVSCFENLLGSRTFVDIRNRRLRCVETGHEVVAGDEEAYTRNKRCRLGLIDHTLSHGKSPLTMFSQCLLSRLSYLWLKYLPFFLLFGYVLSSKLVCKIIGDTVNKNEEHIWKYVNRKRFLPRLEQVERGAGTSGKTKKIQVTNNHRRVKEETGSNDSELWMHKSSSGLESEQESDEENCKGSHCDAKEYEELSERTKRMSIEIGPRQMSSVIEKSAKYAQIAAEEVPNSFYCLGRKLAERIYAVASKLTNNSLYHVCVFSDNIVATSVVVNSTALNSKAPEKVVFHLVTNAMKSWFAMNMDNPRGVTVEVQKFEDFKWLNASYVPVLKQLQDSDTQSYYFSGHNDDGRTQIKFRNPKYLSTPNHLNAQLYLFIRPYKLGYEDIKFL
uniref:Hexosyltransferase n=1 Tax=Brassica oleracea var. oleracea TaxID=109376 RepID=A0A0D3EA11_BRAOL